MNWMENVNEGPSVDKHASPERTIQEENDSGKEDVDTRRFKIRNLRQPGGWRTHPELLKIFDLCENFEVIFRKPDPNKKLKTGIATFSFSTQEEAQQAYKLLSKAKLDGNSMLIETGEQFVFPEEIAFFKISSDDSIQNRTLYVVKLTSNNRESVESIIGDRGVESAKFLPLYGGFHQAEIVTMTEEEATNIHLGARNLSNEEQICSTKVLTTAEYSEFVKTVKWEANEPAEKEEVKSNDKENEPVPVLQAPEIDEEDIISVINEHVEKEKLNWAEVTEVEEIYTICDKVSVVFDGLPDSVLKPAMLSTLCRHLTETESHWMREHLMTLINSWRREVEREEQYVRDTQVVMKAPEYQPVMVNRTRKRKAESSRAGRIMLGVGAFLQSTRNAMKTENGEVEIEEDDSGNIMLNGEVLSFDTWARVNKTSQPDVVTAEEQMPRLQANGKKKKKEFMDFNDYKKYKKEQYAKRMGNKKLKIMDQARRELEELENQEKSAGGSETTPVDSPAPAKVPKELDEGEIDSEEERQMDKKKKKNTSDSSSSSEESDDDGPSNARGRRAQIRRAQQKKAQANPLSNPILTNLFDFRHQLVKFLPLDQKIQFVKVLQEALDWRGTMTMDQNNLYRQLSDDVTRLSR